MLRLSCQFITFDLLTLTFHFPVEVVEISEDCLHAIITNVATENLLAHVLGDLGLEDLKLKVKIQEIKYQERGKITFFD